MHQRIIRSVLTISAIVVVTSAMACSQTSTSLEVPTINPGNGWQDALGLGAARHKVLVVTIDNPDRRKPAAFGLTLQTSSFARELSVLDAFTSRSKWLRSSIRVTVD